MKYASWILVVLLAFVFGCATMTEGRRVDTAKMRELLKGETTREGVIEKLGQPAKVEKMPTGEEKLIYFYKSEGYNHWWTLSRIYNQRLEVILKDGVVQNYVYTRETRNAPNEVD